MAKQFATDATVVVKIGTSIITSEQGRLDMNRLKKITSQVAALKKQGYRMVVVTSGAIACGMEKLGYAERPKTLVESCAAAAVGQTLLMRDYEELLRQDDLLSAQLLFTSDGLHDRGRYLTSRNTMLNLLAKDRIVPIVNENDAVVTDEIKFGDNDKLSAQVATLVDAQILIILSDIDGVYGPDKVVIPEIVEIDDRLEDCARDTTRRTSVGGMITKFDAARIATSAGITMVIANGNDPTILKRVLDGEQVGTWFLSKERMSGKKRWIAFSCKGCGEISVDPGAAAAIVAKGRSLLPIGVIGCAGEFAFGDLVIVKDAGGREIARGLTNYSREELEKIKGGKTADIAAVLGYKSSDEVIHRDNLVVV